MVHRPTMIFHVPFALNPDAKSASGIRPLRLRRAFEEIGYDVREISGSHARRRQLMRNLRRDITAGLRIEFAYSEAATTPTGLGEKITRHTSLTRDIRFLRFCRRKGIPVGLFYRDVYWQFPEYAERVRQPYRSILRSRYRADLRGYRRAVDRLFLPSFEMASFLPVANRRGVTELPPGAELRDAPLRDRQSDALSLFYVGGIGNYYRMQETVRGVQAAEGAALTICTRADEWSQMSGAYAEVLGTATRVVHRSGAELDDEYERADIGVLLMEPIAYRDFAAPMKLYEYLGWGKPVIATEGSLAGRFVEETGIGWAIPYDANSLTSLLIRLRENPEELQSRSLRAREVREEHTWAARARQAASALTK